MSVRKIFNASAGYTASIASSTSTGPSDTSFDSTTLLLTGDVEVDPSFANVSLLLTGNDLVDKSNNKAAVTAYGNAAVTSVNKKFGTGSYYFDGSGDYLSIPSSSNFTFGTGDFTIECWVRFNAVASQQLIIDFRPVGSNGLYPALYISNGILYYYTNATNAITSSTLFTNIWYHISVVRNGTSTKLFINGGQEGSTYVDSTNYSNGSITIGSSGFYANGTDSPFNGYMDDLRITKGVARYTSSFTPPVKALPTHEILDSSVYRLPVTAVGNARIDTTTKKYGTGAMYFDGSLSSYIGLPTSSVFDLSGVDFTIEFWMNFVPLAAGKVCRLAILGANGSTSGAIPAICIDFSNTQLTAGIPNASVVAVSSNANSISGNSWIHCALSISSTEQCWYINGVKQTPITNMTRPTSGSIPFYMGRDPSLSTTIMNTYNIVAFTGYIDDVRVTKGSARYTSNFTPPTESLPTISPTISADPWWGNVSLLLDGNTTDAYDPYWQNVSLMLTGDDFIDWSNNHYSITKNGAVAIDNTTKKYNTGSIKITTADTDYCSTTAGAALGTSNFTIEFWFNSSATSAYCGIFAIDNSSGGYSGIQLTRSGLFISYANSTWDMFGYGSASITAAFNGAWHHVAVCRSGASVYLFIDGVSVGTAYDISTNPIYAANAGVVFVGRQSTSTGFTGYIADFRITRNIARYTANFTPPIAALPSYKIQDRTQNNLTLTPYGNVKLSTDVMKNGTGSMFFDGTGDYLAVTPTTNLVLGTSDFTIEGWFYQTAGGYAAHLFTTTAGYTTANQLRMTNYTGTTLTVFSGGSTTLITASTTYTQNTWNHFALVRSGTTLTLYLNGISVGSNASVSISFVADASWYIGSDSMNNYSWNGYIDDFRVTKGYARYTQNFTPPSQSFATQYISTGYDANYADVSLLLNGNGTNGSQVFTDLSSTPKTITAYGNAQISTAVKKYGTGAMFFDGTGDYLTTPSSSDLDLSSSDFTIEYWVNYTAVGQAPVVCKWTGSAGAWYAGILGTNLALGLTSSGSTASPELWLQSTGYTVPTSTWIHVAFVRSGNSVKLYINGALNNSGTFSGTVNSNSTTIRVGQNPDNSQNLNGYIDDLRITKGIARYTTNFTPPTYQLPTDTTGTAIDPLRSSTSLLLRGNGTNGSTSFVDESPNGLTVTNNGPVAATINTTTKKYGTGSILFAGTSTSNCSKLVVTDTGFGTADFTLEMWVNFSSSAVDQYIFDSRSAYNDTTGIALLYNDPGLSGKIGVFYGTGWLISTSVSTTANAWTHVALCRIGTTFNIFINGVSGGTATLSANLSNTIYRFGSGNDNYPLVSGYLDDIRVTKGYARYTANFTPPTYEDPIVTGTVYDYNYPQVSLLLNGDGTNGSTVFKDLSSSPKTITNTGSVAVNTSVKKFGTGSMAFSGSNYLTINNPILDLGAGSFTIELWWNSTLKTNYQSILIGTGSLGAWLHETSTGGMLWGINGTTFSASSIDVCDGIWHHVAFVRNGTSDCTLYIDGVSSVTASNSTDITGTTTATIGTYVGTRFVTGYIDDLRITKGLARYTANFTPPTAPLPNSYL